MVREITFSFSCIASMEVVIVLFHSLQFRCISQLAFTHISFMPTCHVKGNLVGTQMHTVGAEFKPASDLGALLFDCFPNIL